MSDTMDFETSLSRWNVDPYGVGGVEVLHTSAPSPSERRALEAALVAAFPEYRIAEYFAIKGDVFREVHHVVVARPASGGGLVGLLSARERTCRFGRFLHVEMNLIAAAHQRRGLLPPLWRALLARLVAGPEGLPRLFAIKTYNPMVYSSVRVVARACRASVYPSPPAPGRQRRDRDEPPRARELAAEVAATISPTTPFDPATGVLRGAGVPADFYPALPTTNKRRVHEWFARHLAPGDRLLVVADFGADADPAPLLRRFRVAPVAGVGTAPSGGSHA